MLNSVSCLFVESVSVGVFESSSGINIISGTLSIFFIDGSLISSGSASDFSPSELPPPGLEPGGLLWPLLVDPAPVEPEPLFLVDVSGNGGDGEGGEGVIP